ncbi:MAG: aminopeptidase P family protein [Trueperaceae bacterium]|nr:MAG: aminopeptidase P family protein [Trueperaceae bacterium]
MDYERRLERFRKILDGVADLAFIPLSADLAYLTGVPRDIPNFGAVLHPGAWVEGAWLTPHHRPVLALPRMTAEFGGGSGSDTVKLEILGDFEDPAEMVRRFIRDFELPDAPRVAISDKTHGATVSAVQALLPQASFLSATDLLRPLRVIKSEEEVEAMRRAGAVTEAAFGAVLAKLEHGMTELDVVTEVDYQLRRHGSLGPSFTTSLYNSGPNHPLLFGRRQETWKRVLEPPVSILFDFGAVLDGYCYDYGRTVFFGEPTRGFEEIFSLVMRSQGAGIEAMRSGQVTAAEVDRAARQVIEEGGYGTAFRHRLGHAIGLDVHEPPFLTAGDDTVLESGMMFTVEPSITQFETFSARVEDVVVARPGGGEALTGGFKELLVVE